MFIEPTITRVPSRFSGYIWLDTKIVSKKTLKAGCLPYMLLGSSCSYSWIFLEENRYKNENDDSWFFQSPLMNIHALSTRKQSSTVNLLKFNFTKDGLGIWNVRVGMFGYQPVEMWRWPVGSVGAVAGRLGECVNDDMKLLGLWPGWAVFREMWRDFISRQTSYSSQSWKKWMFSK